MTDKKYGVKELQNGNYMVTGTKGYRIIVNNRYDAVKHSEELNHQDRDIEIFRQQNIEYYTTLSKVKMIAEQIQTESGELHVLQLAIQIKNLINEALP